MCSKFQKTPGAFEAAIPFALPAPGACEILFAPNPRGQGHPSVQQQPSGFTYELRDEDQAEAYVVVAVVGVVVVAVRRPAVLRVVVPTPAAYHTVRTLDGGPFLI